MIVAFDLVFLLTRFHLPEVVINDAKLGRLLNDPLGLGVGACLPLACVRFLDEALPVLDDLTGISLVIEDAVSALRVDAQRRSPFICAIIRPSTKDCAAASSSNR